MSINPHARVMEAEKWSNTQINVRIRYVAFQGNSGLKYGPGVDLWSAGVILFILLAGYPPFFHESEPALYALIRGGAFTFDDPIWDTISDRFAPALVHTCSKQGMCTEEMFEKACSSNPARVTFHQCCICTLHMLYRSESTGMTCILLAFSALLYGKGAPLCLMCMSTCI